MADAMQTAECSPATPLEWRVSKTRPREWADLCESIEYHFPYPFRVAVEEELDGWTLYVVDAADDFDRAISWMKMLHNRVWGRH
jgi:hypothetical protein